jgi:hypothetical protein
MPGWRKVIPIRRNVGDQWESGFVTLTSADYTSVTHITPHNGSSRPRGMQGASQPIGQGRMTLPNMTGHHPLGSPALPGMPIPPGVTNSEHPDHADLSIMVDVGGGQHIRMNPVTYDPERAAQIAEQRARLLAQEQIANAQAADEAELRDWIMASDGSDLFPHWTTQAQTEELVQAIVALSVLVTIGAPALEAIGFIRPLGASLLTGEVNSTALVLNPVTKATFSDAQVAQLTLLAKTAKGLSQNELNSTIFSILTAP